MDDQARELHAVARFEDRDFVLLRRQQFRSAANYVASAFARIPAVTRIALFGSVAGSSDNPPSEGRERFREPQDLDLAVWIDDAADLEPLRKARSRALNQLFADTGIGVAHHQVDVFLLDAMAGGYLGRLCCFNQCPKGKPACQAVGCGRVPFLQQHDGFSLCADSLSPSRISILYERRDVHFEQ